MSYGTVCGGAYERPDLCDGAPVLLRQQARHRRPVVCHVCGEPRVLARWVVDALRDPHGRPLGAHVCNGCDPWNPRRGKR